MRIGGRFMAVISAVVATVAIGYGAVSAHHADVDVKTTCTNDGGYDYVITLSPPDNWGNPTWTLNDDVTQASNIPFVVTGHALIADGTIQVPEYIVWTNGASWSATVEVTAPVNCVVVTTVAPTTEAPTTVVESTVPATDPATTVPGEVTTTTSQGSDNPSGTTTTVRESDSPTGVTTTVATSTGLPSTGSGNVVLYLALIVLGLGTVVVCVTRRSAVS